MKLLLINLQSSGARAGYSGLFFPFGMAYISSVLKDNGYRYDCVDLHTEEILNGKDFDSWQKIKTLDIRQYDVVAFGGVFLKLKELKTLSQMIWEFNKDALQVAGGNMATIISDFILKETRVNCVCLYEGEETIVELLSNLKEGDWKKTPVIKYLDGNGRVIEAPIREKIADLDRVPFPDRENWSFHIIRKSFPYGSPGRYCAIMFASRGCPFSCIFCNPVSGKKVRVRSARNIVEEIKYLKSKWNIGYIRFFDEIFIASKEKIKEFCLLMIKEKLDIYWWCQTQVRLIDEDLLKTMKEAGCIEISYGIESGSNAILCEMNKGITRELAKQVIEMTYRCGIRPSLNLIAGTPSENLQSLQETADFIKQLNYIDWPQVPTIDFIVPLPNTKLYDIARDKGFIKDERSYLTEDLFGMGRYTRSINLTSMSDDDFLNAIRRCNRDIREDFYKKHPFKRVLMLIGLDHLRLDLILKGCRPKQFRPLTEALLWAIIGKRGGTLISKRMNRWIFQ